jgi:transketolase
VEARTKELATPTAEEHGTAGLLGVDALGIDCVRFLAVDAIQKANSGHPGLPMGAAPMAWVLWTRHLRYHPRNPAWPDRDRFVLSAGHGSMLLYALLHLFGYDVSLEDIEAFRQRDSRTPGHPEVHVTPGVEATTGPLGQGFGNAVGLAIAEAHLAARFNRPGHTVVDHHTYVLASDGDLMEGVTAEAASLAGHLGLGKLIVLYDANAICLAGSTALSFTESVAGRFAAYGWGVESVPDGNDLDAVDDALHAARRDRARPTLVIVHTTIGFGAPHKQGTSAAHGSPLGDAEAAAAKARLGWPPEPPFRVPAELAAVSDAAVARGRELEAAWQGRLASYRAAHPEAAAELERRLAATLPGGWTDALPAFDASDKGIPTRKASEAVLQGLAPVLPELVGGSADLDPSTLTWLKGEGDFEPAGSTGEGLDGVIGRVWGPAGRNVHYGVREHAMGAATNGLALHGGIIPYASTFLVFSDYMRPPMRLSALSGLGCIWVFTHDSIGLGEDGPTHQPIEHYAALRAIPNLRFIRPCDANETAWAWRLAIETRDRPTVLALTRQAVPILDRTRYAPAAELCRGAYVLNPRVRDPDVVLAASGSEVALIVEAAAVLETRGHRPRLVSMPCWELFADQPASYRDAVFPPSVGARLAVEAGVRLGWDRWIGPDGDCLTVDRFGASAPGGEVMRMLGLTVDAVVDRATALVS